MINYGNNMNKNLNEIIINLKLNKLVKISKKNNKNLILKVVKKVILKIKKINNKKVPQQNLKQKQKKQRK